MAGRSTRTTALTIRFPNNTLAELRAAAIRHNASVAAVVIAAVRLAIAPSTNENELVVSADLQGGAQTANWIEMRRVLSASMSGRWRWSRPSSRPAPPIFKTKDGYI